MAAISSSGNEDIEQWIFKDRPLWTPSKEAVANSNMVQLMKKINAQKGTNLSSYNELWQWSVDNIPDFWGTVWDDLDMLSSVQYSEIVDDLSKFPGAEWFPGCQLNFAENVLRFKDDQPAYVFQSDCSRSSETITYAQLWDSVSRTAQAFRALGLKKGDRVAAYLPNLPSAAVCMLAAVSTGAIWSSCSPDFGQQAVLDRFGQIQPTLLLVTEAYFYKGKFISTMATVAALSSMLPSVTSTVVVPYAVAHAFRTDVSALRGGVHLQDILPSGGDTPPLVFEQVSFSHPVFIMYSSGTTGKPKCIVQGSGVLLNHLKEHKYHCSVTRDDRVFYYSTTGWMMWNWLTSALALGCAVVLWEGNPCYPEWDSLWEMTQNLGVTVFGTSARYLQAIMDAGCRPKDRFDLSRLRLILSTGSPATENTFAFVHARIKQDVQFASISGGTDLNGCFALGCPMLPVYSAELQCRALGMNVSVWGGEGVEVRGGEGELVCLSPFPSAPLCFWNDTDGTLMNDAYFSVYPGVWRHGDYAALTEHDTPGMMVHGRSDATLNPGGVRIGTADIYGAVDERFEEIADSVVIGQPLPDGDSRVVLFCKMKPPALLTPQLVKRVKTAIRSQVSPRHVPALVLECPDIPYTVSGKKVELAVRRMVEGRPVGNRSALVNPGSLDFFASVPELQAEGGETKE